MDQTWEDAVREIRRRKVRRMFDPFVELGDECLDEPTLALFRLRLRPVLLAKWEQEQGKRPQRCRPTWSLPVGAGRGRPVSASGVRIPHTHTSVGGRSQAKGSIAAVGSDRYISRQERSRPQEVKAVALASASEAAIAIADDAYLTRLERAAIAGGALSAVRTNMNPDPAGREREWTVRTRHERKAGKPRININADRDPALCAAIETDPRWPVALRIAIARDLARLKSGVVRKKSKKAGEPWIDDNADIVYADLCAAYGLNPDASDGAISFGAPRAGRVFYKFEAELPHEFNEEGRHAYLDAMATALAERGLAYVLVMHRPDPLNHPRNHHVHAMYADRPVAELPDGSYDIEQVTTHLYGRGRAREVRQRQPKVRAVSAYSWTRTLRTIHVDLCNEQLAAIGARGRYHAGKFEDAAILADERQLKVGAKAARFEAAGVGTVAGVENALVDWQRVDERRARTLSRVLTRLQAVSATRIARDPGREAEWAAWLRAATAAAEARAVEEEASDTILQATSRARDTAAKAGAIAGTLAPGSWEEAGWRARGQEADVALLTIDRDLSPERDLARRAASERARQGAQRNHIRADLRTVKKAAAPVDARSNVAARIDSLSAAHRFIDRHERHGVPVVVEGGVYQYTLAALAEEAALTPRTFEHPAVQARLRKLQQRQAEEIERVAKLAQRRGKLTGTHTPYVEALVARWREHEDVRRALRVGRSRAAAFDHLHEAGHQPLGPGEPRNDVVASRLPEVTDLIMPPLNAGVTFAPAAVAATSAPGNTAVDRQPSDARPSSTTSMPMLSSQDSQAIERLHVLDVYVADYGGGTPLDLSYAALKAIGRDDAWKDRPHVQAALRAIRNDQQAVVARLTTDAERRPLVYSKTLTRFWPRDLDEADLKRLDRWTGEPGLLQDSFELWQRILTAHETHEARVRDERAAPWSDAPDAPAPAKAFPPGQQNPSASARQRSPSMRDLPGPSR